MSITTCERCAEVSGPVSGSGGMRSSSASTPVALDPNLLRRARRHVRGADDRNGPWGTFVVEHASCDEEVA